MPSTGTKVCIITGASSGIGEATARLLARAGARVVLTARRRDRLEELARAIAEEGGDALVCGGDVARRGDVRRMIDQTVERHGRIDVLVNNAGIMPLAPMAECRVDEWEAMIDVNVKGLLYGIGHALPVMLRQGSGHIVNVSSVAGRVLFPGAAVYCGTKHAVHAISETLRSELAERAREDGNTIRVTTIAPGVVLTELPDSIRHAETRELSKAYYDRFESPLVSEDIAESIRYAIEAPPHVNVNEILVRPVAQVR